jgi:hypothetical protein
MTLMQPLTPFIVKSRKSGAVWILGPEAEDDDARVFFNDGKPS